MSTTKLSAFVRGQTRQPRVHLRAPELSDEAEFLAAVRRSRKLFGQFAHPPATAEQFRANVLRLQGPAHIGFFVIDAATDAIAGAINLNEIVRGPAQSAYLGYYALEPFAGRGFMSAGLAMAIGAAFGRLRLHRLEANIQPDNAPSLALVQRFGFQREGYSPRYLKLGGRWRDHERWALLKDDWRGRRS